MAVSKSIQSVLVLAGVSSARQASSIELAKSFAQLQKVCDVVPIISTLNELLPKLALPTKKTSLDNLRANVEKQCKGKTQFKAKGAALALSTCVTKILVGELSPDEAASSFPDFMAVEVELLKEANPKKTKATDTAATDTAATATETDTAATATETDTAASIDTLFNTALSALSSGLFTAEQVAELRLALASVAAQAEVISH